VDLHVLQRFDLRAETVLLQNERVGIESREDLFAFIETELPQRLEVREVRVVSRSSVPKELLALESATNAPLELNSQNMPMQVGALSDVDLLVPIPSTGDMIGVSTGRDRQSLNSGEIAFLQDLGHCRSVRVHELEVEGAHRKHALRETVLRQQLTEAELRALRAQVNPHFLFNSLNTIADLIVRNPVNAERMTLRLSSVFRHVLAQADRQFVTLTEEFSFLRNYLGIEQERFGENLQVSFEMDPEATDAVLPTLLLQPLVENALKHGLGPKAGKRSLPIVAVAFTNGVLLDVIDNGVGFPLGNAVPFSSKSRSAGVGLANTRARLRAVYGDEGRLVIESAPMQGSRVSLSLPSRR
jgi:two-component system LytT family sensor kinase